MRAVWNALIEFQEEIQGENLLIRCDNATVVAYINKQGGTKSIPLCLLLWDMMQWCLKHNIHIHAAHIPGKKNCLADKLSRGQKLVRLTEWALKPSIVQHIFQIMGTPNIDLFATRANSQLPVFCSPYPDPLAWTCDALSELGGDICICISSPHTHSQSLNESQTRELLNSSGSALSSTSVLVSSTSGVNSGCSSKTTSITRPVVSEQRSVITSKSKKSKSGSVENICRSKSSKQFSSKVSKYMEQSIRSSTRRLYSVRWEIFSSWCAERQISPTSASVGNVADFFVYLHSVKKCKVATIIGYRSAISSKHKGWGGRSVSTNGDLSKLIKGIFNSNPILKPLLPNWDLPSVLWRLCDPPFEPLLSCDVKILTWKTVFLIALATASRVSELHALSVKDGNLRYERHGIRLLPNLQFLSKTQRLNNPWIPIFIPSFHNFATEARDLLLCPYRALKMYIKRTESQRKEIDSDSLFITYQKGVCRPGSKNSVARWIVSLIKWVYQDTSKHLSTVHAHDTRKLATSWALFNGASITEIIRAAHWASESTFISFYMKDVPTKGARFARSAILETAKRKF